MARPYEAISTPPMRAGVRSWAQRGRFRKRCWAQRGRFRKRYGSPGWSVPPEAPPGCEGPGLSGGLASLISMSSKVGGEESQRVQGASGPRWISPKPSTGGMLRLIVVLTAAVGSCGRRGWSRGGCRCRPRWTGHGRGPGRTGRCCGRDGGGRWRGVITGPSAGGDHDDDDGSDDDDRRDRDGYPLAAALLLGTITIGPICPVPVALDLDVGRVRVPAGGLRRTGGLALAGTSGLLRPSAAIPVALAGGRIVRIWVPTWLSPFDQVNSS